MATIIDLTATFVHMRSITVHLVPRIRGCLRLIVLSLLQIIGETPAAFLSGLGETLAAFLSGIVGLTNIRWIFDSQHQRLQNLI